jgi:APA family basic amino acid/polyamine antiporter
MELQRTIGLRDLTLIVLGTVIGSAIFIVPATVLRQSGGYVGVALLVWAVAGVLSLLGALSYGELGAMRPEAGGLYAFLRDAFGPLTGFLYGWTLFFVIGSGGVAALSVGFTSYLGQLVTLPPVAGKAVSMAMIAAATLVNVRGTRQSSRVQNVTTGVKVGAILIMSVALLAVGGGLSASRGHLWPADFSLDLLSGVGLAMVGVLWAYEGWQYATFSAGEATNPQRTVPRGLVLGTALSVIVYCLANLGYIAALGPADSQSTANIASSAVTSKFGAVAGKLVAAAILLSMFSAANGILLTSTRVFYAMGRDGVFFRALGNVHPRFGTPATAIIAAGGWAMVLSASGTYEQLLTYVVFTGWIFYALGAAAVFVLRRRHPNAIRPFRVPGYPVPPALFVLSALAIVVNTLLSQPTLGVTGLGMLLLGVPVYYFWRRRSAPESDVRDGTVVTPS